MGGSLRCIIALDISARHIDLEGLYIDIPFLEIVVCEVWPLMKEATDKLEDWEQHILIIIWVTRIWVIMKWLWKRECFIPAYCV